MKKAQVAGLRFLLSHYVILFGSRRYSPYTIILFISILFVAIASFAAGTVWLQHMHSG